MNLDELHGKLGDLQEISQAEIENLLSFDSGLLGKFKIF